MEAIQKTSKFVVEYSSDDDRVIKGWASVFDNVDSDMDVIKRGAYTKTIKERGPEGKGRIKLVAQHKMAMPIGKILKLEETDRGLYMEAKFGTHRDGEDYYRMAKEGIIDEFSVGFVPVKKMENQAGGYDISEIKLYEVSMVTVAANDEAYVTEVKSEDVLKLIKQVENEDLREKLEYEVLKLSADTQQTTTQAEVSVDGKEASPEPEVENKEIDLNELLTLSKQL